MRYRAWSERALPFLALLLLAQLWLPVQPALAAQPILEDLRYRLSALASQDAARLRLTLTRQGPGRFVAEAIGEPRGFIKLLTGERRERLEAEMVWREDRLQPLVYREESRWGKKRRLKEYRFNYSQGRLELWEWHEGKGLLKKWQTTLSTPIYDPLTAFYNCRLGILGPTREGETGTIQGIPYPRPESIEIRLGGETKDGRQAMFSLINPVFEGSRGQVFALLDNRMVPRQAWTTVSGITVRGYLLSDSVMLPPGTKELPGTGSSAAH